MNWLVVMPAWGPRALYCLVHYALPSILEAAHRSGSKFRFLVHTDKRDFVQLLFTSMKLDCLVWDVANSTESPYLTVSYCYQAALATFARHGEAVLLCTADMVLSIETFAACEAQFAAGKHVVVCCGGRAIEGNVPPSGVPGEALTAWMWAHRHPWMRECTWGEGATGTPSYVIFRDAPNVWLHAFHLHPLALVRDERPLPFFGTIDFNLVDNFPFDAIHIVQDPAELAVIEISPIWHANFTKHAAPNTVETIATWAKRNATKTHRWLFEHPIRLIGEPGRASAVNEILQRLAE